MEWDRETTTYQIDDGFSCRGFDTIEQARSWNEEREVNFPIYRTTIKETRQRVY